MYELSQLTKVQKKMTEVPKKQRKVGKKPPQPDVHVPDDPPHPETNEETHDNEEVNVDSRTSPNRDPDSSFTASQGRLRKLFIKAGLSGRISKDVFEMLDDKIKCLVLQRVKNLKVKDKKLLYDEEEKRPPQSSYELPLTPFREYLKSVIRREHDISRISPDVVESLHYSIEKDVIRLCQYAQDIMKNSSRKTLFANDIEVAAKALLT